MRPRRKRWRRLAFALGDCAFLLAIGWLAVAAVQVTQSLPGSALLLSFLGMGLAMLIQMGLSFLLAPLLGSIETMTPSMVVAMFSPMVLEGIEMAGFEFIPSLARYFGALCGALMFGWMAAYAAACQRRFQRTCATHE